MNFSNLTNIQKTIVCDTNGVVLVLAGAGSGKTRVLTHRIEYLVKEKNIPSYNILAITFTNKATNEMKRRLYKMLGENNQVFVSTFHAFCAYILRHEIASLGYSRGFTIYDASDQKRIVNKLLSNLGYDGLINAKFVMGEISYAKQLAYSPEAYLKRAFNKSITKYKLAFDVFLKYEEYLTNNNCLDFDDLLLKTLELFQQHPDVLAKYHNWFHYIHVDEFQDTNIVQLKLVELLQQGHGNLFVVGDDDQSIYSWRGANIDNILRFDDVFKGVKIYKLEENFRSTNHILEAANNVIKNNVNRREKTLFTKKPGGPEVVFKTLNDEKEEARFVAYEIEDLKYKYGIRNSEIAILVRQTSLTRNFEHYLNQYTIPYKLMGGTRFFERAEIKDIVAYMNVLYNPNDDLSLIRAMQTPRKGIGETTISMMHDYIDQYYAKMGVHLNLHDIVFGIDLEHQEAVSSRVYPRVLGFKQMLIDMQNKLKGNVPLLDLVKYIIERAEFKQSLLKDSNEQNITKWSNIEEFVVVVRELMTQGIVSTLDQLLERLSLVSENKEELEDTEQISIATIHSVKGLEFKVVFIVGCEVNIFPSIYSMEEGNLEEERRLMYVAITRAKERLYVTNADWRWKYSGMEKSTPSMFVNEAQNITLIDSKIDRYISNNFVNFETDKKLTAFSAPVLERNSPDVVSQYQKGVKVKHRLYEEGEIIAVEGEGDEKKITVNFGILGQKVFVAVLAKLDII